MAAAAAGVEQKEGGEEWSGCLDEARLDLSLRSNKQHHPSLCHGDGNLAFILSHNSRPPLPVRTREFHAEPLQPREDSQASEEKA